MKFNRDMMIGSFVILSLGLALGLVIVLGEGSIFSTPTRGVVFFDGSVNGLRIGAPVSLNGVTIGSVYDIKVEVDGKDESLITPVFIEVDRDRITKYNVDNNVDPDVALKQFIERGLRAQLKTQSFVTGLLFIELSFKPSVLPRWRNRRYPLIEIPSMPSPLDELRNTIDSLPLEDIVRKFNKTLESVEVLLSDPEVKELGKELNETLRSFRKTSDEVSDLVSSFDGVIDEGLSGENKKALSELFKSLDSAIGAYEVLAKDGSQTLGTLSYTFSDKSKLRYDISRSLEEVSSAARALREFAEYLKRNPNALVTGKK